MRTSNYLHVCIWQLSKTLQDGESEDVRGQMRDAKRETKQRFLDEANKSATEGEETAASAEPEDSMRSPLRSPVRSPVPRLDIGDGDVDPDEGPSTGASGRVRIATDESPQTSSRTVPKTPRSASKLCHLIWDMLNTLLEIVTITLSGTCLIHYWRLLQSPYLGHA